LREIFVVIPGNLRWDLSDPQVRIYVSQTMDESMRVACGTPGGTGPRRPSRRICYPNNSGRDSRDGCRLFGPPLSAASSQRCQPNPRSTKGIRRRAYRRRSEGGRIVGGSRPYTGGNPAISRPGPNVRQPRPHVERPAAPRDMVTMTVSSNDHPAQRRTA